MRFGILVPTLSVLPLTLSVQIGVIVAVGVLLDTFLVRSLLIPALAIPTGAGPYQPIAARLGPIARPAG